jgi:O-antigen/teichoic acid export membrane protein
MKKELGRFAKHTSIYGLGVVASKAAGFLLIPVYTRLLQPRDYGVLEILDLIMFFSGLFAATGIYSAVFRFYAAYETEEDKKEVIATALLYNGALSAAVSTAIFCFASQIAGVALGSTDYSPFVRIVSITLFFSNLTEVPLAYWRAQARTTLFVAVSFARTLVSLLLNVVALVILKWGVEGVLLANLSVNVIAGLALLAVVAAQVPRRIVSSKLKEMLRYGLPIVPSYLVSFLLVFSDRFFLRHFASLGEVGVYSLGYKLAGILAVLVSGPFSMAWSWQQFELAPKENGSHFYAKIQTYRLFVSVFIGLGISVFARDVLKIMTTQPYWSAYRVVPLITLSYILADVRSVVLTGILVKKATHYLPLVGIGTAVANALLNYFLISRYLAMGAAIATVLSYAVHLILTYSVAQRVQAVPYEYSRNALILGTATVIYLASTFHNFQLVGSTLVNATALFLFLLISFKLLDFEERVMLRQATHAVARRCWGVVRGTR